MYNSITSGGGGRVPGLPLLQGPGPGRGDGTVGNPRRARISQFELFEFEFLNSSFSSLSSD